jgi:hypothetical protein
VPIIDLRAYDDDEANQHDRFRTFVTRARLIAANGNATNQVVLTYPRESETDFMRFLATYRMEQVHPERALDLVRGTDRWLDSIASDRSQISQAAKVARDKPAELADACWATNGEHIVEPATYDGAGQCNQHYPSHSDPRIAAGGPLTDDILKCALKPVSGRDYSRPLDHEILSRLSAAFPTGVCDYSRRGVGQETTKVTWQRF